MKEIIYVGIDNHNDFIVVGLNREGQKLTDVQLEKMENAPNTISKFFKKLKIRYDIRACYEAGPCGYTLHHQLSKMNIKCEVIAPSLIPKSRGDKVKTDKRDAKKLTQLYRGGYLTPIRVPTAEEDGDRALIRCREQYTEKIKRVKHQIGKFLVYRGIKYNRNGQKWTLVYRKWLDDISKSLHGKEEFIFEQYLQELSFLEILRNGIDVQIKELFVQEKYKAKVNSLRCFRGIETYTAMALLTTVIDFRRFARANQFMSYIGLTPGEYSSGNKIVKGQITKNGNSFIRKLLVEASKNYRYPAKVSRKMSEKWKEGSTGARTRGYIALTRLHDKYYKLLFRKNANKAAIAVARELCGFIWAAMNDLPLRQDQKIAV